MIDGINRIYAGQIQPVKPTQPSEKKESVLLRDQGTAARLLPDLRDKVEISKEGREAAKAQGVSEKHDIPKEEFEAITRNWYSVGYRMAAEMMDSMQ